MATICAVSTPEAPPAAAPAAPAPPVAGDGPRWVGWFHLGVLYVVWSTTYLAIRLAVEEGSGFPPFGMAATRLVVAGLFLFAVAFVMGRRLSISRRDLGILTVAAVLLWLGGNGLVTWAERVAASGYAALLVGAMPIWTSVIEATIDRRMPSARVMLALAAGFAGVGVLTVPALRDASIADALPVLALLLAPLSWGAGAVLQGRRKPHAAPVVSAAWQQLLGGLIVGVVAVGLREPMPAPTPVAFWAWAYLAIVGSLAFLSFVQALKLLPTRYVMTYAYVNPVGAALLGWLILGEPLTAWTVAGAALVLVGVAGVFRERYAA